MSEAIGGHDWIMARAAEMEALGETDPRPALDEVDMAMIRHWAEAIGDDDPRWRGAEAVAPPAMSQVWTMYGLDPHRPARDPLHGTMQMLDEAGYTSVLGTNCDQTYVRYLRPGERTAVTTRLTSVVGPKRTGVGEGYFVTTESVWRVDDEEVATMTFRVLKFKPGTGRPVVDRSRIERPVVDRDNVFFFEGTAAGELRIQKCNACGELRHPPGPVCPSCHAMDRGWVLASGSGRIVSFVIHHAPQIPGRMLPLPIALVELEEGVRMVGVVLGGAEDVAVGDSVQVVFDRIDDDLTLPAWRVATDEETARRVSAGEETARRVSADEETARRVSADEETARRVSADEETARRVSAGEETARRVASEASVSRRPWAPHEIPITATLVVSAALATRDFQDVHHDRDLAVQRGSKDIFTNILTTTGQVQAYVGARTGHRMRITSCALRLGAPAHPGDTLVLTGTPVSEEDGVTTVDVVGTMTSNGAQHVTARITYVEEDA